MGVLEGYRGPLELSRLEIDRGFRPDEDVLADLAASDADARVREAARFARSLLRAG